MVTSRMGMFAKQHVKGAQIAQGANYAIQTGFNLAMIHYFSKSEPLRPREESMTTLKR